eukprot:8864360-Pyramimonas_sp.AAC.1
MACSMLFDYRAPNPEAPSPMLTTRGVLRRGPSSQLAVLTSASAAAAIPRPWRTKPKSITRRFAPPRSPLPIPPARSAHQDYNTNRFARLPTPPTNPSLHRQRSRDRLRRTNLARGRPSDSPLT